MTDVRQLLDDYDRSYADPDGECAHDCDDHRGRQAPKAFAALGAVLDLHVDDAGDCRECGVDAVEEPIRWPCATVRAITTALEAK